MDNETAYFKILRARSQAGQDFKNPEVSDEDRRKYLWRFLEIQKFLKEIYDGKSNDSLMKFLTDEETEEGLVEAFFIAIQSRRNGHIPEVIREFIPDIVSSLDEEPVDDKHGGEQ